MDHKVYLGGVVNGINFHGSQIISPIDTEISDFISKADLKPNRITTYETATESVITDYMTLLQQSAKLQINSRLFTQHFMALALKPSCRF
jgi:phosphomannomutase